MAERRAAYAPVIGFAGTPIELEDSQHPPCVRRPRQRM